MMIYIGNLKELAKKTPRTSKQLQQGCRKVVYKSQLLSYVPAMNRWNFKLKTQYHLNQHPPKMKYFVINLTKQVKEVYIKKTTKL